MSYQPLNPTTYVDKAETNVKKLMNNRSRLSNSQLRNTTSKITEIYDEVLLLKGQEIPEKLLAKIAYLRVHIVYAASRDRDLKSFIETSELLEHIKDVCNDPSKDKYILLTHYTEALIAYHAYLGGGR